MTTFVYGITTPPQSEEEIYSSSQEEISPQRRGCTVRANMARSTTQPRRSQSAWDLANTDATTASARQRARQFGREAVLAYNNNTDLPHAPSGRAEQVIC